MRPLAFISLAALVGGCASSSSPVLTSPSVVSKSSGPPMPPALAPVAPQPLVIHPVQSRMITLTWENHFQNSNEVAFVEATPELAPPKWTRIYTGLTNQISGPVDEPMQFFRAGNETKK